MKTFTVRAILSVMFVTCITGVIPAAQAAEKKATAKEAEKASEDTMAALSCFGYGYKVKVLVNGADIGVAGGMSEGKRLFTTDSAMASQAPPEMRKKIFVLKKGENKISVEYTKQSKDKYDHLDISLQMEGYPAPLFSLKSSSKPSGKVEKSFVVSDVPTADFKPVVVTD